MKLQLEILDIVRVDQDLANRNVILLSDIISTFYTFLIVYCKILLWSSQFVLIWYQYRIFLFSSGLQAYDECVWSEYQGLGFLISEWLMKLGWWQVDPKLIFMNLDGIIQVILKY